MQVQTGVMQDWSHKKEGCMIRRMQEMRDTGEEICRRGEMEERRDKEKKGCGKVGIYDRRDAR